MSPTPLAPDAPRPSPARLRLIGLVAALVAAVVVIVGLMARSGQDRSARTFAQSQSIPVVAVSHPQTQSGSRTLVLPGNLQAWYKAQIFARVSGYVHAWYDDIGASVHAGQVLATIDTPELDAQISQARADLTSAKAGVSLAQITARRWASLLTQDAVSRQESDEKSGDLAVKTAQEKAAEAALERLLALKRFARITAPFNGVVTARKTDIGALVNAGAGANATSDLFEVSQIQPLRLYVNVPQAQAGLLQGAVTASLTAPEFPGRSFPAKLQTNAKAVSETSGTVLVELTVDNRQGLLKAGDYVQVTFSLPSTAATGTVQVPASALIFRNSGPEVAVVGADDRAKLRRVSVGRDLGSSLEIAEGLSPSDRIIDNPPDSIVDGELVRIAEPAGAARP